MSKHNELMYGDLNSVFEILSNEPIDTGELVAATLNIIIRHKSHAEYTADLLGRVEKLEAEVAKLKNP